MIKKIIQSINKRYHTTPWNKRPWWIRFSYLLNCGYASSDIYVCSKCNCSMARIRFIRNDVEYRAFRCVNKKCRHLRAERCVKIKYSTYVERKNNK